ncbi:MAG: helix-turn-helix domain-containing protein, partial [Planctomycetes bacterium]|nr:helix-turn-helix domain-containing protein [Planctomycetota bacterium]
MANELKMGKINALLQLAEQGWSHRRIARELGVDRRAVARHLRLAAESSAKGTISTTGSEGSKPTISTTGSAGRKSTCEPFEASI